MSFFDPLLWPRGRLGPVRLLQATSVFDVRVLLPRRKVEPDAGAWHRPSDLPGVAQAEKLSL
jgi:hypothetical protein